VESLDALEGDFQTHLLVGPAFAHADALALRLSATRRRFEVQRGAEDVAALMSRCDLAIASFGMTAYELAALGVPAILLCLTEDHARSASALADAGAAISLGVHGSVSPAELGAAAASLLRDPGRRAAMSRAALGLIDGRGAERTAELLASSISRRRPLAGEGRADPIGSLRPLRARSMARERQARFLLEALLSGAFCVDERKSP
jgi:spore coat polysaccharide biosynthesis predicted glycosyltransferase SpsG